MPNQEQIGSSSSLSNDVNSILNSFMALTKEEQLLQLEIKKNNVRTARGHLMNQSSQSEINKNKRKSTRVTKFEAAKKAKISNDSIVIPGVPCTLGTRILRLGEEITVKDAKTKYCAWLSKNGIIDVNPKSNQLDGIEKEAASYIQRYQHSVTDITTNDTNYMQNVSNAFKTVGSSKDAKNILNMVEQTVAKNDEHRAIKNIHRHILEHIIFKSHTLSNQYLNSCTELSILIKTWAYIFEEYFGYNNQLVIQWGDSISPTCKISGLNMRLDIRIITKADGHNFDVITGEAAKTSATSSNKYYNDKVKSVLATKCHLNHYIQSSSTWTKKELLSIKFPLIQLMGTTCRISSLQIIDKGVYILNDIYQFSYPKTIKQVKKGAIDDLLKGLVMLETMVDKLKDTYQDQERSTDDEIKAVENNTSRKGKKYAQWIDWTSNVEWPSSNNDGEKEEDSDDDEKEEEGDEEDK